MNNLIAVLEKIAMPVSEKLATNRYLTAISKGLMQIMPALILGSIASIFLNLPIDGYQAVITDNGIKGLLNGFVNITTNMIAVYGVFSIAFVFISNAGYSGFAGALTALICFFFTIQLQVTGEGPMAVTTLNIEWLGAKGLFVAMFVSLVVGTIFVKIMDRKLVIKMPEGVPKFVSDSFVGIVPAAISALVIGLIVWAFSGTDYGTIHNFVYKIIQTPLQGLGNTLAAAVIIYLLEGIVWFFGIHAIAVAAVVLPIWLAADAQNLAAAAAGVANSDLPNIVTWSWVNTVCGVGGAGATLGLVIWFAFKAKAKQHNTIGRLALVPSLFNINEPVVFGVPVVLNPILLLPFILTPVICITIAYVLTVAGILPHASGINAPAGTPIILGGFLVGGWKVALWQFVTLFISLGVYFPFFKILDKQAVALENK